MNELFRLVGRALTTVVKLGVIVYVAKYGFDAYHGRYCLPVNSQYTALRDAASVGNDGINLVATNIGKAACPAPPVFVPPHHATSAAKAGL